MKAKLGHSKKEICVNFTYKKTILPRFGYTLKDIGNLETYYKLWVRAHNSVLQAGLGQVILG